MTNEIMTTADQELALNSNLEGYICTFDMSNDEEKLEAIAAYNDALPLAQHVGEIISLKNVLTCPGVRKARNETQQDTPCQNTYLIDTDGIAYYSQSDGVAKSVNMLVKAFPTLDYKGQGYIDVVCVEKVLANNNTLKTVKPILTKPSFNN